MNVAWIGLGQMGSPMAARLLEAGHDVVVWNRTSSRADPLVEKGASRATTPAEAASSAEVVVTMIADPAALEDVVFGDDGLATGLGAGSTFVEMSTVGPDAVRALAERLPDGVAVVDAPVLGSVAQATDGELKVFAGGDAETIERIRPLLDEFGRVFHLGGLGSGASMKLVTNSTLGTLMSGLGEALALADALGLDDHTVLDILVESPIGRTAQSKRERIQSGEYPPNFKLSLAAKDLGLVEDAARAAGVPSDLAAAARAYFAGAEAAGLGPLDYSAVVAHLRQQPPAGPDE